MVTVNYFGGLVKSDETLQFFVDSCHTGNLVLLKSVMTTDISTTVPKLGLGTSFSNPSNPTSCSAFYPRCHVLMITKLNATFFEDYIQNYIERVG